MRTTRLTAAAPMALPGLAAAQAVTLYGVVDTGVEYVNHIGVARDSVTRMPGRRAPCHRAGACMRW
ncbi:porin (plasmid) [Cupriavidus basilensis]